jgi:hypothetical protein
MNFKKIGLLVLISIALIATSCRSRKGISNSPFKAENKASIVVGETMANNLKYDFLSQKARVKFNGAGKRLSLTMNIRTEHEKKIWISVTAFGAFEAVRAVITPDSIQVLDRVNSRHYNKPFDFIQNFIGAEVTFSQLEAIFVGNFDPTFIDKMISFSADSTGYNIGGTKGDYEVLMHVVGQYQKLQLADLNDLMRGSTLNLLFDDFQDIGGTMVPFNVIATGNDGKSESEINLTFTRIEKETELKFPFNVPDSYEKVD